MLSNRKFLGCSKVCIDMKSKRSKRRSITQSRIAWAHRRYAIALLKAKGVKARGDWSTRVIGSILAGRQLSHDEAKVFIAESYVKGEQVPNDKRKTKADIFLSSREWRELRYKALVKYGRVCMCCGSLDGPFHVDHIKPRSRFPDLALKLSNLQILCEDCNIGKSNKDQTDFRSRAMS